jgi:hypothetical protein
MKLRSLIVVALALVSTALPSALHAQVGVFLNPIAMRITNSVADTGDFAFLGQNSKSQMFYGPEFGGYYDYKTQYGFKAGIEMRDAYVTGGGAKLNSFLFGIRISGQPFHNALKPYIEPAVGVGSSRAPFTTRRINKAQYGAFAGLDYTTHHHVDFRLVEIGYNSLITASSETIGGHDTIPAANIFTISTGLVFRFP